MACLKEEDRKVRKGVRMKTEIESKERKKEEEEEENCCKALLIASFPRPWWDHGHDYSSPTYPHVKKLNRTH